jgi:hypothetical protein
MINLPAVAAEAAGLAATGWPFTAAAAVGACDLLLALFDDGIWQNRHKHTHTQRERNWIVKKKKAKR